MASHALGGPRPGNRNVLLKIVILGDGGVGKSCLMNRYVNNQFNDNSFHTIGVEFLNKDVKINDETYTMQIWDTAGQERFKSLRTPFYRGTDICMLTFAVDDRTSFKNLTMWKNEFLHYANIKDASTFPFIVVASKADIGADKRVVTESEIKCWCEVNDNIPYIETSSKDAINVETAFALGVDSWKRLEEAFDKTNNYVADTVNLSRLAQRNSSKCCSN
ncbi:hypothetical protein LSTR_LSTR002406 [Laodelphax striatellus]|uniref:small monomeric GTPase n=1 Tax=Laodelphax striatellus TaxID=195883 RepID=A0A482X2R0_LAOST|nr:hypothetical protein LSTR_LSTR002406 [Laodelphax striatellus]